LPDRRDRAFASARDEEDAVTQDGVEPAAQPVVGWRAEGDVAVVGLHRPPANALGLPIIDGLSTALDEIDAAGLRAVVLTSSVDGFFAAGADIKHMAAADADAFAAYGDRLRAVLERVAEPGRIVIAAVEGVALGGGLELALACTLRVAGGRARFGLPEVRLGLIPGAGGTQRLPRLVGRGRALDLMLTARQVPAAEAHAIGLVDRLVDDGAAESAAVALAGQLRAMSQPALAAVVRCVDAAFDVPLDEGLAYERNAIGELFTDGEAAEGIAAFVAKRPPRFA
jgi:enoyl-CoA hydratase/carnithine racemase